MANRVVRLATPDTSEFDGVKTSIIDTQKENNLIVHLVNELPENPEETFNAVVNAKRRTNIANNHTATHLLHAAIARSFWDRTLSKKDRW